MPPLTNNPPSSYLPAEPPLVADDLPQHRKWPGRLLLLALLLVFGGLVWQRQAVADWIKLREYQPPAQISQLASQTTMTGLGQHLFYINEPHIAAKDNFANNCKTTEQAIVLGCYHGGENGIFILQISNTSELGGVMQVTAAHEMLHAAYERLSSKQKTKLNTQLESYYQHDLKNERVQTEIAAYKKFEPNDVVNEMHSVFGTELADLPSSLEQYYSRYFTNRQTVVAYASSYQAAFDKRTVAIKRYDGQLTTLKVSINKNQQLLQSQVEAINTQYIQLQQLKANNQAVAYNKVIPVYNQKVDTYNQLLQTTKTQITQYNRIVAQRNALVSQEQQLSRELSGSDLPAPSH